MSSAAKTLDSKVAEIGNAKEPLDAIPWLPCTLTLDIPVADFTIGSLLKMSEGNVVETACHHTADVPLRVNGQLIGWTEFEVLGEKLAIRITELA